MRHNILHNFISPISGKMHLPKGNILIGDENNLTSYSTIVSELENDVKSHNKIIGDLEIYLKNLENNIKDYRKLPKDYIFIGNREGNLIASPILIDIRLDIIDLNKNLYLAREKLNETINKILQICGSTFVLKAKNGLLPNSQILSDLKRGLLKNTSYGELNIASGGKDIIENDYVRPIDLQEEINATIAKAGEISAAAEAAAISYFTTQMLPYVPLAPLIGNIGVQIATSITNVSGAVGLLKIDHEKDVVDLKKLIDEANNHSDANDVGTLRSANGYSDNADKAILILANDFTTQKATEVLTTTIAKDTEILKLAQDYSDNGDNDSKSYTDSKIVEIKTYVNEQDKKVLTDTSKYADDLSIKTIEAVNKHSDDNDKVTLSSANSFSQNLVTESLQVGKDYTDGKLDGIKTELNKSVSDGCAKAVKDAAQYSDKKDTVTLKNANNYTDSKNWKTSQVVNFKEEVIELIKSEIKDNSTVDIDERIKLQMELLVEQTWLEKLLLIDEVF